MLIDFGNLERSWNDLKSGDLAFIPTPPTRDAPPTKGDRLSESGIDDQATVSEIWAPMIATDNPALTDRMKPQNCVAGGIRIQISDRSILLNAFLKSVSTRLRQHGENPYLPTLILGATLTPT